MAHEEQYFNRQDSPLKIKDYDRWFLPCKKCGYDVGRVSIVSKPTCWRCGTFLKRDYTKRALKTKGE